MVLMVALVVVLFVVALSLPQGTLVLASAAAVLAEGGCLRLCLGCRLEFWVMPVWLVVVVAVWHAMAVVVPLVLLVVVVAAVWLELVWVGLIVVVWAVAWLDFRVMALVVVALLLPDVCGSVRMILLAACVCKTYF